MDFEIVVLGFLYDVVEDIGVILGDVEELFGYDVVVIVDGVIKLGKIWYKFNKEQFVENYCKLLLVMFKDI